jgi:hypothetical protein
MITKISINKHKLNHSFKTSGHSFMERKQKELMMTLSNLLFLTLLVFTLLKEMVLLLLHQVRLRTERESRKNKKKLQLRSKDGDGLMKMISLS